MNSLGLKPPRPITLVIGAEMGDRFLVLFTRAAARVRWRGRLQAGLGALGRAGALLLVTSLILALIPRATGRGFAPGAAVHDILPALLLAWALARGLASRFDETLIAPALDAHLDTGGLIGATRSAAPDFAALLSPQAAAALDAAPRFPLRPRNGAAVLAGLSLLWGLGAVAWRPTAEAGPLAAQALRASLGERSQRLPTAQRQRWEQALAELEQGDLATAGQELQALVEHLESQGGSAIPGEARADAEPGAQADLDPLERSRLVAALKRTLAEFSPDEAERQASTTEGHGRSRGSFPSTVGADTAPGHGEHGPAARVGEASAAVMPSFPSPAPATVGGDGQHIPGDCRDVVARYFENP